MHLELMKGSCEEPSPDYAIQIVSTFHVLNVVPKHMRIMSDLARTYLYEMNFVNSQQKLN